MEIASNVLPRIGTFFGIMFLLWCLEWAIPLVAAKAHRKLPNLYLTLTALLLYFSFLFLDFAIAAWTSANQFGVFRWLKAPDWAMLVGGVLILDLIGAYWIHWLFHRYGWLWRFHQVHHADEMVDVTTTLRQHPFDSVFRSSFVAIGLLVTGLPLWVFVVYQTLSSLSALIEHANIRIPDKLDAWLSYVFVTPNFHKLHHSSLQKETDSNYANIFSLWDHVFSTASKRPRYDSIHYGLDIEGAAGFSFWQLLKLPFKKTK